MTLNDANAVKEQYRTAENLRKRISIHEKYSTNRQGFGNWVVSHYQIEKGMSVLELGCGTGGMWIGRSDLISKCSRLILSDLSGEMLREAQTNLAGEGGIAYKTIDIQKIPFEENSFDAVIANMTLHHVPDIPRGLAEVRRVLKQGGTFYCAAYGAHGITAYLCDLFGKYGVKNSSADPFTLQNGEEQLLAFFSAVRRLDYEDSLEVTDPQDVADYMLSLGEMSELKKLPREILLSELEGRMSNGVLRIPKEYGMFISKK